MEVAIFYLVHLELWCGSVSQATGFYKVRFFTFEPSLRLVLELVEKADLPNPVSREGDGRG